MQLYRLYTCNYNQDTSDILRRIRILFLKIRGSKVTSLFM
uniref:Uncharacterized protein n=1 Tax=Anguilla anguilla TaxID=7936 RepID=A0A0E9WZK7_ANGAN